MKVRGEERGGSDESSQGVNTVGVNVDPSIERREERKRGRGEN